jgi:hypothetical protein
MALPLLTAFSCAYIRPLTVSGSALKEAAAGRAYSVDAVAFDFAKVTSAIDGWRSSFGFSASECNSPSRGGTPLCKRYEATDGVVLDVKFSPSDNLIDIILIDYGRSKRVDEIEKSLRSELVRSFGASAVRGRYEK